MRTVIVHYHIYKNAGTSFDHVLGHSFGDRHVSFDGPFPFFGIDQDQLDRIVLRRPHAVAFSSHQIVLPVPSSVEYRALAAILLRNPLLRIASIYRFKRGPERADGVPIGSLPAAERAAALTAAGLDPALADHLDMTTTAVAARGADFAGWLDHCLRDLVEIVHVSNAQTRFLAAPYRQRPAMRRMQGALVYDLAAAMRMLSGVELLGRTEMFEADVARFARILAEDHAIALATPGDIRKNVTEAQGGRSTAERVEALLSGLPPALRDRLLAANAQDLALYARASRLIDSDHRP